MDCPHLESNVKIEDNVTEKINITKKWQCAVCTIIEDPWMCLHCGIIGCGRFCNGHMLVHSQQRTNHSVCMHCDNFSVFCYLCDEFVGNDTSNYTLQKVRMVLSQDLEMESSFKSAQQSEEEETEAASTPSSLEQDLWKTDMIDEDEIQENVRTLRPRIRKRSYSSDGSTENRRSKRQCQNQRKNLSCTLRDRKVLGLRNLGNTCFMNAVLQSLSNIEEFSFYIKQLPSLDNLQNGAAKRLYRLREIKALAEDKALMAEELRKILISLRQGDCNKGAISPESLFLVIWKIVPRFRGYQQQDAHEFLRYMLDRLHTELLHLLPDFSLKENSFINLGHKNTSSIVTMVFGGTLQSEVRCLNCNTESKKHDPFLDLSLDIPEKFQGTTKKPKDGQEPAPVCHIADCLASFIDVEELADTELYYCNYCKSKQRSTKRFWIRRLPNVLCLHLKRFRWNTSYRTKIDTRVSFPVAALDMSQFVLNNLHETRRSGTGSNLYDLAAVIVHHGSGVGSGHYTAFAVAEGQWFHFNDSTVRPTEVAVVAKCKPYILFYIRREFRLPNVTS